MLLAGLGWAYLEVTQQEMDACGELQMEVSCAEFFTNDVVEIEARRKMLEEAQRRMRGQDRVEKHVGILSAFLDRREVEYVFAFLHVDMANFIDQRKTYISRVDIWQMLKHTNILMSSNAGGPFFKRGEMKATKLLLNRQNFLFEVYAPLAEGILDKRNKVFDAIEKCDARGLEAAVQGLDANFKFYSEAYYDKSPLEILSSTSCSNGIELATILLQHGAYPSEALRQRLDPKNKAVIRRWRKPSKEKKAIWNVILQAKTPEFPSPFHNEYRVPPSVAQGSKPTRRSRKPNVTPEPVPRQQWQSTVV